MIRALSGALSGALFAATLIGALLSLSCADRWFDPDRLSTLEISATCSEAPLVTTDSVESARVVLADATLCDAEVLAGFFRIRARRGERVVVESESERMDVVLGVAETCPACDLVPVDRCGRGGPERLSFRASADEEYTFFVQADGLEDLPLSMERAICGDGVLQLEEGCDDANLDPGDGCDARCRREIDAEEREPNNVSASANVVSLDTDTTEVGGVIARCEDDYFVIQLDDAVAITSTCDPGGLELTLFGADGRSVRADSEPSGSCSSLSATGLIPGPYFVRVHANETTMYTLRIQQ